MITLPPAFLARAQAVKAAHAHLAATRPGWGTLSQPDRFRAVHQHLAQQTPASLRDLVANAVAGRTSQMAQRPALPRPLVPTPHAYTGQTTL